MTSSPQAQAHHHISWANQQDSRATLAFQQIDAPALPMSRSAVELIGLLSATDSHSTAINHHHAPIRRSSRTGRVSYARGVFSLTVFMAAVLQPRRGFSAGPARVYGAQRIKGIARVLHDGGNLVPAQGLEKPVFHRPLAVRRTPAGRPASQSATSRCQFQPAARPCRGPMIRRAPAGCAAARYYGLSADGVLITRRGSRWRRSTLPATSR